MVREAKTEVLVVGAGPVGMMTALALARRGIAVELIDAAGGAAAHSYACALHPHSLELLDQLGLIEELLKSGRRIDTVAFYDGPVRRAEIRLSELTARFPFLVVLPQSILENLLETALNREAGIKVRWHHRFSLLRPSRDSVEASVAKLGGTSLGYIVPHWEVIVQKTKEVRPAFLVGADGCNSLVRQSLGIGYAQVGEPESFLVFEFETDAVLENEVRVVFDDSATSVLWPLPNKRCRWSFQMTQKRLHEEFPPKQRRSVWIDDPASNWRINQNLERLVRERAPWFKGKVKQLDWVRQVQFERRLAKQFGGGRCWLVGDAAHQTSPVGVQSVNVGLREAAELAGALSDSLHAGATAEVLGNWNRRWRGQWKQLLGLSGAPTASPNADDWLRRRAPRILPCVPASGSEVAQCLKQIQLDVPWETGEGDASACALGASGRCGHLE
jgi:2-polyprenyl-6-methoxyphenol hydroxylase-like FAD-dependent oxidoreductase